MRATEGSLFVPFRCVPRVTDFERSRAFSPLILSDGLRQEETWENRDSTLANCSFRRRTKSRNWYAAVHAMADRYSRHFVDHDLPNSRGSNRRVMFACLPSARGRVQKVKAQRHSSPGFGTRQSDSMQADWNALYASTRALYERIYCYVPVKYGNSRYMADISNDYRSRHRLVCIEISIAFFGAALTRRE